MWPTGDVRVNPKALCAWTVALAAQAMYLEHKESRGGSSNRENTVFLTESFSTIGALRRVVNSWTR